MKEKLLVPAAFFSVIAAVTSAAEPVTIRIDGSNGVLPLVKELVEPFQKTNPGYIASLGEGWSSKTRLQALAEGKMDIAMASHGLKPEVLTELKQTPHLFAKMAVVFAVHDSVAVRDLTAKQLAAIYRGDYTNWKQVGGPDLTIVRLMRPEDEVDAEVIRALLPEFKELTWAEDTKVIDSSGDLATALNGTPGAIGVTTLVRAENGEHIRFVKLAGTAPTEENVRSGKYILTRNSYLVTPNKPSEPVQVFLDFLKTEAAKTAIRRSNAIPWDHASVSPVKHETH